jgi:hypothetical protein
MVDSAPRGVAVAPAPRRAASPRAAAATPAPRRAASPRAAAAIPTLRGAASARGPCAGSARSGSASPRGSARCTRCSRCSAGRRRPRAPARHVRVADQRPVHAERVGDAAADELVRLDGVDHAGRGDQRRAELERVGQVRDQIARGGRRRHDPGAAVERGGVADRHVHVVDERRERRSDRAGGRGVRAQPHTQREPGRGVPHRLEHLGHEPRRLAVAILAAVPLGRERTARRGSRAPR